MNRLEAMSKYLKPYVVRWSAEQILRIRQVKEENLLAAVDPLLQEAYQQQRSQNWQPAYLSIFFLYSSCYTGSFEYQISITDDQMYMDSRQLVTYWRPSYLPENINEEREKIIDVLSKKFVRIKKYEIEYCLRLIMSQFKSITEVYLYNNYMELRNMPSFLNISNGSMIDLIYGDYMGEIKTIK